MKKIIGILMIFLTNLTFAEMTPKKEANEIVKNMSAREKLGQMIMMDFRNWNNKPFTIMNDQVKEVIKNYDLGGVILFRENIITTKQTIELTDSLQKSSPKIPLFIGTDQEGGYVTRLSMGTEMPGNMALGAGRSLELTRKVGETIGSELYALGINFDFAPVVDVNSNQKNPVIGVRSFGDSPKLVGELSSVFIEGLQSSGITSTIKHFPGHGNTSSDSHIGLATVNYSEKEWTKIDKIPFEMAIDSGVDAIMTAHVIIPALDDTKVKSKKDGTMIGTPATLSKPIMTGILREGMGYKGLIITDALNMKAISENFGESESVINGILAGGDIMLMPVIVWNEKDKKKLESLYTRVLEEMKTNEELSRRVDESARRIVKLKLEKNLKSNESLEDRILKGEKLVGNEENKAIEKVVAEKGITLIKNNDNILPMDISGKKKILFIAETKTRNNTMEDQVKKIEANVEVSKLSINYKQGLTSEIKSRIDKVDYVVMVTGNLRRNTKINDIINYANKEGKKLVTISGKNPYDIIYTPTVRANIAIYGITGYDVTNNHRNSLEANVRAGIKVIFKGTDSYKSVSPTGKLPVDIRGIDGKILYERGYGLNYLEEK
ncbi:MAG: glycoside hydrolase family 3 protein [Psychrilyobacter sp.]|nr:glycoside hydrolase family 3 protein [Psychrilyobacter sp.]